MGVSTSVTTLNLNLVLRPPILIIGAGTLDSQGSAKVAVGVPNVPSLVGFLLRAQTVAFDPTGLVLSQIFSWRIAPNISRRWVRPPGAAGFPVYAYSGSAVTSLADGTLLACGGAVGRPNQLPTVVKAAYTYDPVRLTSLRVGDMTAPRQYHTATLLDDGTVLVVGGDQIPSQPTAELYDPKQLRFLPLGPVPVCLHEAFAVPYRIQGRQFVLFAGGSVPQSSKLSRDAFLYDVRNRRFSKGMSSIKSRYRAVAVALPFGGVLIAGGFDTSLQVQSDVELFVGATSTFFPWGAMTRGRIGHGAVSLDDRHVAFIAGYDWVNKHHDVEIFDVVTRRSVTLPWKLSWSRIKVTPIRLADGTIALPDAMTEVLTASGPILLRPIPDPRFALPEFVALPGGGALAYSDGSAPFLLR